MLGQIGTCSCNSPGAVKDFLMSFILIGVMLNCLISLSLLHFE